MPPKKRKYQEEYVSFGFKSIVGPDGVEKPQCFICGKVLINDSLKPTTLRSHLQSQHAGNQNDTKEMMLQKKARFEASGTLSNFGFAVPKKPLLEASYNAAYRIARSKKPHTIGETLIKPCALEMVEIVCGKAQRELIEKIPLSNNTISRRINTMSEDILTQVVEQIKNSPYKYSMQLDESTDCANLSQLLVCVRYFYMDDIKEEFLFCEPLMTTTKAENVFRLVRGFLNDHGIPIDHLGSICTDGAPAMLGNRSGFSALVRREVPHVTVTHCVLHRQALASKTLPDELKNVLATVVSIVNFIRGRALNHRLFMALCNEMGSDHEVLLFHTEVRWLSRGRVLNRVLELKTEVAEFLREKNRNLHEKFTEATFVFKLAYLADVFALLNELNTSLQGRRMIIFDANEKINAFKCKLALWKRRASRGNFANFPTLDNLVEQHVAYDDVPEQLQEDICTHLVQLENSFAGYFQSENNGDNQWIRNPFTSDMDDDNPLKDQLIELKSKDMLKNAFQTTSVEAFWCSSEVRQGFANLASLAVSSIMPFVTTYLCESGFSTLVLMKTKYRNRLNVGNDMRLALSNTAPRIKKIVSENHQEQISH